MLKRVGLFVATNLAVITMIGVALALLEAWRGEPLAPFGTTLVIAGLFGMGGALFSLLISKPVALWTTGAKVISDPKTTREAWLLQVVRQQAEKAGIGVPDVAVYAASDINAFATGWNRNKALVAVSEGLLRTLSREEAEAVLGHEISHIANGDMVTLTLLQGVLNTFVILAARLVGTWVDRALLGNRDGHGLGYLASVLVLQIVFGLLASLIVCAFSRWREFRADAGGATLTSSQAMRSALARLEQAHPEPLPESLRAFGITAGVKGWFSTHPPLRERIMALERNASSF